jgi:hypothetical protein
MARAVKRRNRRSIVVAQRKAQVGKVARKDD